MFSVRNSIELLCPPTYTPQTSDELWQELHAAGEVEYDRFWRLPLDEEYGPQIYSSNADLQNVGLYDIFAASIFNLHILQTGGRPAGSATAALFLKAFAEGCEGRNGQNPTLKWAHIDIAGSMEATRPSPYQEKGMTGRPVRYALSFFVLYLFSNLCCQCLGGICSSFDGLCMMHTCILYWILPILK